MYEKVNKITVSHSQSNFLTLFGVYCGYPRWIQLNTATR